MITLFTPAILYLLSSAIGPAVVNAQVAEICESVLTYKYDSGETNTVSTIVQHANAPWIQLDLTYTDLASNAKLIITGPNSSSSETITAETLANNGWSAVFDGDSVKVELVTHGNNFFRGSKGKGDSSRVVVSAIKAGVCDSDVIASSICGATDDRIPSTDARAGRIGGCTGWLISEDVFLQAGHCGTPGASTRMHFTYGTGSAAAEDQYAVVPGSYKSSDHYDGGTRYGHDFGIGRLSPNSVTGKLPGVAQGGWYGLGSVPSSTAGVTMRVTGYGTATVDSRSQKTHTGGLAQITGSGESWYIRYTMDTTGGNSGSPAIHEETGKAIGIHTHGGCNGNGGGANAGTRIDHPRLAPLIEFYLKTCSADSDCSDSQVSNGLESCVNGKCQWGEAPTMAPVQCSGEYLTVEIKTDNYPGETSYTLTDKCKQQNIDTKPTGSFTAANTLYTYSHCVDPNSAFDFTINDSYGDGICCSYGVGSYKLTYDGTAYTSPTSGNYGGSETIPISTCGGPVSPTPPPTTASTTTAPSPPLTTSPTLAPTTLSPTTVPTTNAPTLSPTSSPTPAPTRSPTLAPTTNAPTPPPTTSSPTPAPTTNAPSLPPTSSPTSAPTTLSPTSAPTTNAPTPSPTTTPSTSPTMAPTTNVPTPPPSAAPTNPITPAPTNPLTLAPTNAPTPGPTLQPSTPGPTPCNGAEITVDVLTDNWPQETAWTLTNTCNGAQINSPSSLARSTQYLNDYCLPSAQYTFEITDTYGDGICCSYGQGSVSVVYNGNPVLNAGAFGSSISETFGTCVGDTTPSPTPSPLQATIATFDSSLGVPKCSGITAACTSGLVLIRGTRGNQEPNPSNTLDGCSDGTNGVYHSDESVDQITVSSIGGDSLQAGTLAEIEAKVWAWSDGSQDMADFYYSANVDNLEWKLIGSRPAGGSGERTLKIQYTIPSNSPLQAVRVSFRYQGNPNECPGGGWDESDDLVFAVDPTPASFEAAAGAKAPIPVPPPKPMDSSYCSEIGEKDRKRCEEGTLCIWKGGRNKGCYPNTRRYRTKGKTTKVNTSDDHTAQRK